MRSFRLGACLAALLLAVGPTAGCSGCGKSKDPEKQEAPPLTEVSVKKVTQDLSQPDPSAAFWNDVPAGSVKLISQPMIAPRPETLTTALITVQAAHDGTRIAFRLQWKDTEKSEAGHLGEFSDALALEFPASDGPLPPVMMGGKDMPVHLFHWRAQYQRDQEQGKPTMETLYPHKSTDMYPLEFKEVEGGTAADREKFAPGVAEGNPQSYAKKGVDEIIAEGFSTSAVQQGHGSAAHGEWKDGEWSLVIVRPIVIEGGSTLKVGTKGNMAFAVWQGGKGEVGSRKCLTMQWYPVNLL